MLNLPQVTLCCVDTRLPYLALAAMKKCMAQIFFGEALLFTRGQHGLTDIPKEIKIIEVDFIQSIEDYSRFLIKGLGTYLKTSHMLIVQWDGYVWDPEMWNNDFLSEDYIGAVWPQYKDQHKVGNGGFSLRSRKLLDALSDPNIEPSHPEDVCIARTHRLKLERSKGIRFADESVARRFAFEREQPSTSSFGFHGLSNFPMIMSDPDLSLFIDNAPAELFTGLETRLFVKRLIKRKFKREALIVLRKRAQNKKNNLSDLKLWFKLKITV